jgi:hypothetical protein
MLVIDAINNVSMSNGLVRIQVVQTGADGKQKAVEEIAIPASQYGNVVTALQRAGQNLQQKAQQKQASQPEQPAVDPAEAADNFDFS